MSEVNNPLFEDQREFLERQKEEYKNALLSDVAGLKDQSQKVGQSVLLAGGVLTGIFFLSKALSGRKQKKEEKKSYRLKHGAKFKGMQAHAWSPTFPEDLDVEDDDPLYSSVERTYPAVYHPEAGTTHVKPHEDHSAEDTTTPVESNEDYSGTNASVAIKQKEHPKPESKSKPFFQSKLVKVVEQQLAAVLVVYLTKQLERYVQSKTKQPVTYLETIETIEVIEPQTTASEYHLHTDEQPYVQPPQF